MAAPSTRSGDGATTTAICFDLDGTLLRYERPYGDMLAEVFEAVEDDADPAGDGLITAR